MDMSKIASLEGMLTEMEANPWDYDTQGVKKAVRLLHGVLINLKTEIMNRPTTEDMEKLKTELMDRPTTEDVEKLKTERAQHSTS